MGKLTQASIINFLLIVLLFVNGMMLPRIMVRGSDPGYFKIEFFDVGQGDSFMISTPDQFDVLVDTGQFMTLTPELRQELGRGGELELMIISHFDSDHMGVAEDIIRNFEPQRLLINDSKKGGLAEKLSAQVQAYGGKVSVLESFTSWRLGCCAILDLLPVQNLSPAEMELAENDRSIIGNIAYGDFDFLFMGDLSAQYEEILTSTFELATIDLLKISHHGSKTSTAARFLSELGQLKSGVIQVGSENKYGHPHPDVIQNLVEANVDVYRTDLHGQIRVISDGELYKITVEKNEDY